MDFGGARRFAGPFALHHRSIHLPAFSHLTGWFLPKMSAQSLHLAQTNVSSILIRLGCPDALMLAKGHTKKCRLQCASGYPSGAQCVTGPIVSAVASQ
jgi:hypothetical protein